ncbi:MAG: eukaryotic translation initiation factor 4E [Sclerophora amabilis]|nr:MAG: eukaryotic translation initiation factor 4E [Sclerophora amabilis]
MASPALSSQAPTNGAVDSRSPVPLDTIPISPEDGSGSVTPAGDEGAAPNGSKKEYGENEQITVFHDADNFTVKHPLMHKWTLWFTKPPSGKGDNWNDLLKEVVTFDSVEEFWGVYNNITPTSELALKSDYHLFKQGVRPEWEDSQNKHGGKWAYQFKEKRNVPIDELWLHVMLAAIGETLENEEDGEVTGVVVNVRKGFYRIGLWTKTVGKSVPGGGEADVAGGKGRSPEKGKEVLMEIGRKFRDVLRLRDSEQVEFSGHTESAHSGSSRAKAKFVV